MKLYTGRYQWFRGGAPEGLIVCGVTVGSPKFPMKCEIEWSARWAAPWGMLDVNDLDEFTGRYFERLDRMGVGTVRARLLHLHERHDGADAVLCCFEDVTQPGEWCHRRVFSSWAQSRLGIEVPEWEPVDSAPTEET